MDARSKVWSSMIHFADHWRAIFKCQLALVFGLRIIRDCSEILTHSHKCGCGAAHVNIAHDMPRSSCCADGQLRETLGIT